MLLEYIYTDTCSEFTNDLLQLATQFSLVRLEAMCNFKLNNVNVNLLLEFPSTLTNDLKKAYLNQSESTTTEDWIEIIGSDNISTKIPKPFLLQFDYFSSMLRNQMQESIHSQILLPDISSKTIQLLLSFIITGIVETDDGNQLMELMYAANQLCMDDLRNICETQLAKHIDENSVKFIEEFAIKYNFKILVERCKKFQKQTQVTYIWILCLKKGQTSCFAKETSTVYENRMGRRMGRIQ